jgi:hypothetical protein
MGNYMKCIASVFSMFSVGTKQQQNAKFRITLALVERLYQKFENHKIVPK